MALTWIIIAIAGTAGLVLWAHDRYYAYRFAELRRRVRSRRGAPRRLARTGL